MHVLIAGLDNLGARLAQYKAEGVEFARWRSVFKVGKNTPSYHAIITNSTMIARFASICQSQRILPIIEPEVIILQCLTFATCENYLSPS